MAAKKPTASATATADTPAAETVTETLPTNMKTEEGTVNEDATLDPVPDTSTESADEKVTETADAPAKAEEADTPAPISLDDLTAAFRPAFDEVIQSITKLHPIEEELPIKAEPKEETVDPACNSCPHWKQATTATGECRRNPPSPVPLPERRMGAIWPITKADDWCGEFEAA